MLACGTCLWAYAVIIALLLIVRIPVSSAKVVNPKPVVLVILKAPRNGLPHSAIFYPIENSNMSPSLCLICFDLFSTITVLLLNQLFHCASHVMLKHIRRHALDIGIFCALHTYSRQFNQHPHIHLSVTREGLRNMTRGHRFFSKKRPPVIGCPTIGGHFSAGPSFNFFSMPIFNYNPKHCLASGTFGIIRRGVVI